jgi:hypothetical protein
MRFFSSGCVCSYHLSRQLAAATRGERAIPLPDRVRDIKLIKVGKLLSLYPQ